MLSVLVTVFSLLVFFAAMGLCIWLGLRRGWFNSAMRLSFFLLAGVVSFFLAKAIASALGTVLVPALTDMLEEASVLSRLSAVTGFLVRFAGGLLAPLLFVMLFFVIDKLTLIAYIPLKKKFADRESLHAVPHDNVYGAVLGAVLALCITITCVMPVSGYVGYASDTAKKMENTSLSDVLPASAKQDLEKTMAGPVMKADVALSGWLFQSLAADLNATTESAVLLLRAVDSFAELASSSPSEALASILSSPETVAVLADLLKDAITTIVPDGNPVLTRLAGCLKNGINALSAASGSLPKAEFQQEVQVLSDLVNILQQPESVTPSEAVETVLKSRFLTEAVASESQSLLNELHGETIELSNAEKKNMKAVVKRYKASGNTNENVSALLEKLFELQ